MMCKNISSYNVAFYRVPQETFIGRNSFLCFSLKVKLGGWWGWWVGALTPENTTERTASCTTFTRVSQDGLELVELLEKYKDGYFEIPYASETTGSVDSALSAVGNVSDLLRCTQPSRSGHSSCWALGPDRVLSTPRHLRDPRAICEDSCWVIKRLWPPRSRDGLRRGRSPGGTCPAARRPAARLPPGTGGFPRPQF